MKKISTLPFVLFFWSFNLSSFPLNIETLSLTDAQTSGLKESMSAELDTAINKYIDEEVIPHDPSFGEVAGYSKVQNSYTRGLVGQIRQDKRSAQLDFDI